MDCSRSLESNQWVYFNLLDYGPRPLFVKEKKYFLKIYVFFEEKEELIISTFNLFHLKTLIPALTPAGLVAN